MKNKRGLIIGMWLGLTACFNAAPALAADVPAPGKVQLKVETKNLTPAQAAALVSSGDKVTLGVYLVLDAGWKAELEAQKANRVEGQMSFGFFNDKTYTSGDFLQNAADYIEICIDNGNNTSTPPRGTCCTDAKTMDMLNWYATVNWQNPGAPDGNGGLPIGWPDYAYGNLFTKSGQALLPPSNVFTYCQTDEQGNYIIKLFDIQFILKKADRDFPVAILDNDIKVQGAQGASELKILNGSNDYWPSDAYKGDGSYITDDWTGLVSHGSFSFVPGGLFIERGPEVEALEPCTSILLS